MKWLIESLVNLILELVNDLMGWAIRLVEGFELNIGVPREMSRSLTSYDIRDLWAFINPIRQYRYFEGPFDKLLGGAAVNFTYIFWMIGFALCVWIFGYKVFLSLMDSKGASIGESAARFLVAFIGVAYSYTLFVSFERVANLFYLEFKKQMLGVYKNIDSKYDLYHQFTQESFPADGSGVLSGHKLAISVICLFIGSVMLVEFIKLIFEFYQRYVLIGALYYTSPIAVSTIASKDSGIFKSWLQMVISQFIIMGITLFFLTTFASAMINISQGNLYDETAPGAEAQVYYVDEVRSYWDELSEQYSAIGAEGMGNADTRVNEYYISSREVEKGSTEGPTYAKYLFNSEYKYVMYMLLLASWLVIGQRVDEIMRNMGLSAARTGQALGGRIMSSIMLAGSAAMGAAKLAGGLAAMGGQVAGHAYERHSSIKDKLEGYEIDSSFAKENTGPGGQLTKEGHNNLGKELKSGAKVEGTPENSAMLNDYLKGHGVNVNEFGNWDSISADGEHFTVTGSDGNSWDIVPNNGEYSVKDGHLTELGDGKYSAVMNRDMYNSQLEKLHGNLSSSNQVPEGAKVGYVGRDGREVDSKEDAIGVGVYSGEPNSDGSLTAYETSSNKHLVNNSVYTPAGTTEGNAALKAERGHFAESGLRYEKSNYSDLSPKAQDGRPITPIASGDVEKGAPVEKNKDIMRSHALSDAKSSEKLSPVAKYVNPHKSPDYSGKGSQSKPESRYKANVVNKRTESPNREPRN